MSRFVKPEPRVLTLADGSTLTVRKRLNREEHARMMARMRPAGEVGFRLDAVKVGLGTVVAYLLDWNLLGDTMPIAHLCLDQTVANMDGLEKVLNNLDPDAFKEIVTAIEQHEEEMQAERDAAKKAAGGSALPATSGSPSASAGATSGSAT